MRKERREKKVKRETCNKNESGKRWKKVKINRKWKGKAEQKQKKKSSNEKGNI